MACATDDERREVAERLRSLRATGRGTTSVGHGYLWSLLWAASGEELDGSGPSDWFERFCARLADLIEPAPTRSDTTATHTDASATCDVSQCCRSDVDPTGRGIDSVYEWCRERLEGADGAEDELYCAIMRAIEEYRHPERATAHTVRAVDREALLALADEMELAAARLRNLAGESASFGFLSRGLTEAEADGFARRIREACGEVES